MSLLLGLTILNVALILAPLLVALPPVRQTPAMLAAARAAGKLARPFSVALALILAVQLWRMPSASALAMLLVAILCAVLSRVSVMEMIFAGARAAETPAIGEFHDIDDADMVIGVVLDGQSRAYPVRFLAYHHMVNDRLGRAALLPTY
jgi:hypothetical protein